MTRLRWVTGLFAVALLVAAVGEVRADRTVTVRSGGQRANGTRVDITVPYLTNGRNAFGAANVAPLIYKSPTVDDPKHPQAKPVFNLIFYGAKQGFGDKSNGAKPK
jgi:hypothetical protein